MSLYQPGLQRESQDSQHCYIEIFCLEKPKQKKKKKSVYVCIEVGGDGGMVELVHA